ncbi:MAG: SPOR domain-containing protein [Flavobacteriales bacterium]|nr:SPOR domain-containing protein [Flavobacteriales bacterium]
MILSKLAQANTKPFFELFLKVEAHIASLLYRYDCVIIPGFGGFVVSPRNAEIRGGNDQFHPPAREIAFNQNLTRNDGLLADAVAAKEKVAYEAAVRLIEDFNRENLKKLSAGAEVEFKDIGVFSKDTTGVLRFEPDAEANFSRASFGLSSFHSPAIKRDTVERSIERKILKPLQKEAPPVKIVAAKEGVSIMRYWPAAAVILMLVVAGYVFKQTNVLSEISVNYSFLNPFDTSSERTYDPRSNGSLAVDEKELTKDEIDLWLERIPEEPVVKVQKAKVVKRFHIIGGCFEFDANAHKLMRRLKRKGFDPTFVGKNRRGLQRVAFGSYKTRAEARKALKEIKRKHMWSAWLYVSRK